MNPGDQVFVGVALEVVVKSVLLLGAALTLIFFMRRSSAALRHLLLAAAALSLLVLPLASMVMPSWNIVPAPAPLVQARDNASTARAETLAPEDTAGEVNSPISGATTEAAAGGAAWLNWLLIVWGAGGLILLVRLVGGKIYGYWIAGKAPAISDERLLAMLRAVSERFGITRHIPVIESDYLRVPFVCGLFRPRLIMPPKARNWPSERLDAVLHHELAHIKRMDILVQFLAQFACCIYWMNPLTWIMERRLFIERERACDDMAIDRDIKASNYAGHLMEVMEEMGRTRSQAWVVSAIAEGTDFKDRIISVLDPAARRTATRRTHLAAVIAFSALLVLPLSALHLSGREATLSEEAPRAGVTASGLNGAGDDHSEEREGREGWREEQSGDRQSDALIALLQNPGARVREHAAGALGESGNVRAVPALIEALGDGEPSVREHVAVALGKIGDARAVSPLIRVLRSDRDTRVREHAASALGMVGDNDDGYRTLVDVYDTDPSIGVRAHAAYGLGLMRAQRAFDLLVGGLGSRHPEIRLHCAEALGLLGVPRAVPHLESALGDHDSRVRESARRALEMMRNVK